MRPGVRDPKPEETNDAAALQPWAWSSGISRIYGTPRHNGTFSRNQIFFRDRVDFRRSYSHKAVEHGVDAIRIAVEKREAGEIVHQAEAWHVRAHASLEHRIIICAKFYFHRPQFVFGDFFILHFADDLVVGLDGSVGSELRTVINLRNHFRRAVGIKNVHTSLSAYRNFLFENELAVDASGTAAVQNAIQDGHGVPVF